MKPDRPRILCISLSPIHSDARVLRQIELLAEFGHVTTVGFGTAPDKAAEHFAVPDGLPTLPQTAAGVIKLALRRHRSTEIDAPAIRWVKEHLHGRRFDLVVANEARVLGLAHLLASGAPVWADMHEWAPEERTHILSWRLLVAPFMTHLCSRYLPEATLVTTVSQSIAKLYDAAFGTRAALMRNAGPFRNLAPSPTQPDRIRLVHSGAAIHGRRLELMLETMALLDRRFSLDLYLMPGGDGGAYLKRLQEKAAADSRIVFHEPVAPEELPGTLNGYDVGVFWIPPTHTNARLTLPNKFFDYVQARLAVAVGPSPEMQLLVERYDLGRIATSFSAAACAESLRALSPETLASAKEASDRAAHDLNFEHDARRIRKILGELLDGPSDDQDGALAR